MIASPSWRTGLSLSAAVGAWSVAAPALADPTPTPVAPVVVTAPSEQSSAPLAGPEIADRALGGSDTAGVLTALAGVDSEGGGGFSSRPTIHGLGDDRITLLVDGAPVALACPNHMNPPLSYTDPHATARAVAITGVSSVSLGGDSLGGAILVDTLAPGFTDTDRSSLTGEATAYHRSNGDGAGGSLAATLATDRLSLAYAGSAAQSGDYKGGGSDGRVRSTGYETYDPSLALAAKTQAGLFDLHLTGQSAPYEAFPNAVMDMTRNDSWGLNAGWRDSFGWGEAKARAYYQDTLHGMNFLADKGGEANGGMPMRNRTVSEGGLVEADVRLSTSGVLRLGGDANNETLSDVWAPVAGNMMEGPNAFVNVNHGARARAGAFAEWEQAWTPKLSTVLGVRGDLVWMNTGQVHPYAPGLSLADDLAAATFNAADRARRDSHVDVSALARWRPSPRLSFDLGLSRKTRSPSLYERYAWSMSANSQMTGWFGDGNGYVGDLNLKPEIAETLSASAELTGAGSHPWVLRVNPWHTHVRDFIDADPLGPLGGMGMPAPGGFVLLQFANHRAELYGADLSGSFRVWNSPTLGALDLQGSAGLVRGENLDTGSPLYHIMPPKARLEAAHTLGPWRSRVEVVAVDRKDRVDLARNEPVTSGYTLVNLQTRYGWRRYALELGVDNLFDTAYAPPLGGVSLGDFAATGALRPVPGRGRSVNVGLSARF